MVEALAACLTLYLLFFRVVYGCPGGCTCTTKYSRVAANCAYGSFQFVPVGLPSNLSRLSLSANAITSLKTSSFAEVPRVSSLWLTHNEIGTIQQGTFTFLIQLKSLDLSHNHVVDFPWEDLSNLTILNLLKMDNNRLASLPREAFNGLRNLRSLQINDNRLTTIVKGTFDSLGFLSNLQIHNNFFNCTCPLQWLNGWSTNTPISIAERESIVCFSPKSLRGIPLGKIPNLQCSAPSVQLNYDPNLNTTGLQEGFRLMLHCNATGSPRPAIKWKIQTSKETNDFLPGVERQRKDLPSSPASHRTDSYLVFPNRTLVIPSVSRENEGIYTCMATNEMGIGEGSVEVAVAGSLDTQYLGVKQYHGNMTEGLQHCEVVVISPPGEGAEKGGGETLLDASAWCWMFTTLLFIL